MRTRGRFITAAAAAALALLPAACASIGNPQGGAIDEAPPVPVRANPPAGATGVSNHLRRASVWFDELVNVKDAFSKVTVSPPPASTPRVTSSGHRVDITFTDTLLPATTYIVDFADAIEDVNEANPLDGFSYSFSTGNAADTLRIAGAVLGARDLEPRQGMLVGVHTEMNDSAFRTLPFVRMTKTDSRGRFVLRGLPAGVYRLFALDDANRDYRWDNPAEDIAFYPATISPSAEPATAVDSIYNPATGKVDSVARRGTTRFLPDDILLSAFNIDFRPQYLVKYERPDSAYFRIVFGAPPDSMPRVSSLKAPGARRWLETEYRPGSDTVTYWIREPALVAADTLDIALTYRRHTKDRSALEWGTDTLHLRRPAAPATKKVKKKKGEEEKPATPVALGLNTLTGSVQEVNAPVLLEVSEPLARLDTAMLALQVRKDTLWIDTQARPRIRRDSTHLRRFLVDYPWEYATQYRLRADSAAFTGIYGHVSRPLEHTFNTRKEADYGSLTLTVNGLPDTTAYYAELLDASDRPLRTVRVRDGEARFRFLRPAVYYARIYADTNGDSIYTTGSYADLRQPEDVFYYPGRINVKGNWDVEQAWDPFALPADAQKPEAIRKNKPKTRKAPSRRKKKGSRDDNATDEDDDYFDVNSNPFDPNQKRRRPTNGVG